MGNIHEMGGSLDNLSFPCSLTISIPLPTHRLASSALRALRVDEELSPLVRRSFSLAVPELSSTRKSQADSNRIANPQDEGDNLVQSGATISEEHKTVLHVEYLATTNRMLRVAVNGFMENLGVVLGVMEELDVDVLAEYL